MILKLVDKTTGEAQSFNIRSNEDFTPIIMQYPEVRSIVFFGYENSDLSQDYSPRLRKITDAVAEYLKQFNLEVSIESENIWEMHDPIDPFEKSELEKGQNGDHKSDNRYQFDKEVDRNGAVTIKVFHPSVRWGMNAVSEHPEGHHESATFMMENDFHNKYGEDLGKPPKDSYRGDKGLVASLSVAHTGQVGQSYVFPSHRRKGIANSMYAMAQEHLGKPIKPDIAQSNEAKALWAQKDRPFGKAETFVTAASMLLALTTTFIPANLAKADITKQVVNVFKYRPYGHKSEDKFLQAIMELESSGGMNQNHQEPNCVGRWGLMSATIKDMVRLFDAHNPDVKDFVNLDTAQLKQIFKKHPELELHIARILARYVIAKQKGDMSRAAYSWKYGQNTPANMISDEKLANESYIQKFMAITGKMNKSDPIGFDQKLKEWIGKRKQKEADIPLWSPSQPDYTPMREPDPAYFRDTSKLRANIARANK
jgi:hypothetical protein